MNNEFDTKEYILPDDNEILELTEEEYKEDFTSFEQDPLNLVEERNQDEEIEKKKKSLKEKWNDFSLKKKIIIVIAVLFLLFMIFIVVSFLLKDEETVEKPREEPAIVIEKDNYKYDNGFLILLDKDDNEIGKYDCKNKDENLCRVAFQNNEDDFDEEQFIYEDGSKLSFVSPIVNHNYAFIYDDSKEAGGMVFFYDLAKNEIIEKYNSVKSYKVNDKEYFIIENSESKYGLFILNEEGLNKIIDFKYDYLGIKKEEMGELEYLVAEKDGKYLIVDKNGKEISKKISNNIKSFDSQYIVVEDDGEYSIVDYRNNKLLKNSYDYIILQENFFVGVQNKKVLVLDYNEVTLNNGDIIIPNEYYNKTYVYDESNNLIETKESFWLLSSDNTVTIEYYKNENDVESQIVNIYEGLVSQNYDYISYYDGSLFIYSDEAKTNLLGTYKCTNKNDINSIDSIYNNCYIAKESSFSANELSNSNKVLGYLPVINKRFVFINDTMDQKVNNIVLYDLQENKTLGSYLSVDAGIYDGRESLGFLTNSELKVIGKSSRKNKYGVISIAEDKVSSLLTMEYNSLERVGNHFLVENAGGTYQLFDQFGQKLTEPAGSKIINYVDGYIKTHENDKYSIYSFDLKKEKEDLDYAELKDEFFVVINDSKISIYNYSDFETPIVDAYPLETEEYKYTYITTNNDYGVVVSDSNGDKITLSLIVE